jgi:RNA polymerase sigma-70 factor (ECF subfamily)
MSAAEQTWDSLTGELRRYVARRVRPDDVDDLVQEVLLRVVATEVDEGRSVAPLAQTVARNAVIDRHRKRTATPPPPEPTTDAEALSIEAQAEAQRALLGAWIKVAASRLPEPYREAVHQVDVLQRPQADVADALGIPYSTLKSRVQRGRAKLRAAFFRCCDAELDARGRLGTVTLRGDDCDCC